MKQPDARADDLSMHTSFRPSAALAINSLVQPPFIVA